MNGDRIFSTLSNDVLDQGRQFAPLCGVVVLVPLIEEHMGVLQVDDLFVIQQAASALDLVSRINIKPLGHEG
jgi:hypothetical protein